MGNFLENMNNDIMSGGNSILQPLQPTIEPIPHTATEAPSSLIATASTAILSTLSYTITSLALLLVPVASQLQRAGETLLAALFLLSIMQAMVALYQYRYDARGQLVFPDGLTVGKEDFYADNQRMDIVNKPDDVLSEEVSEDDAWDAVAEESGEDTATVFNRTDTQSTIAASIDKVNISWATQFIKKLNKSLVLLLPWITRNVHNILTKNTHLFHIGFIVFILDSLLPFIFDREEKEMVDSDKLTSSSHLDSSVASLLQKIDTQALLDDGKESLNLLVLGDSLGIGTGCVEKFDVSKDNSVPMALIENTSVPNQPSSTKEAKSLQGPVFPQVLARTLSYHFQRPVQWRSAGVDGGDVGDIRTYCMDIVAEESSKHNGNIDFVVVLFGMNDLKKMLSVNPIQHLLNGSKDKQDGASNHFRCGMESLLSDINAHAKDALVVFPALPIQPFHKNSIINIFPLGFLVDSAVGLWERQKKIAAGSNRNGIYVDLKTEEISQWYASTREHNGNTDDCFQIIEDYEDINSGLLLSADGVHPNKRMYAEWANLVGHKLYKYMLQQKDQMTQTHGHRISSGKTNCVHVTEKTKDVPKPKLQH